MGARTSLLSIRQTEDHQQEDSEGLHNRGVQTVQFLFRSLHSTHKEEAPHTLHCVVMLGP